MTVNECKERVVRAAVAWVNVNDQGSLKDLARLTKAQIRLVTTVTGYERALNRLVRNRKKRQS